MPSRSCGSDDERPSESGGKRMIGVSPHWLDPALYRAFCLACEPLAPWTSEVIAG